MRCILVILSVSVRDMSRVLRYMGSVCSYKKVRVIELVDPTDARHTQRNMWGVGDGG